MVHQEYFQNQYLELFQMFQIVVQQLELQGDQFGALQKFDFYIDTQKIGDFVTDENGHFITTAKIPNDKNQDRVDFKVRDYEGTEKKLA